MKKYELTNNAKLFCSRTLHQIKALRDFGKIKKGDLGGFIEKEDNLSHNGECWVYDGAWVFGNACVSDNARVFGNAQVLGNAKVYGNARVFGNAKVYENAMVFGDAWVFDDCWVLGDAKVYGKTKVTGNAGVSDNTMVYGSIASGIDQIVITIPIPNSEQQCDHEWVNVGFTSETIVCKYCDKEKK